MAQSEVTSLRQAQGPEISQSKSQRAYHWIKGRIANQDFTPGYRLVLGSIAKELDMSVVPVREAIRQLEAEGLVTFERNVGAHVSMVDDSQYRFSMQALSILEGTATALAARRLTADDIGRARAVNELMVETLDHFDPRSFTALNHEFHSILFAQCANPRMLELVNAEWARLGHLRDSTFSFVPGRAAESVREHESILALIEKRRPTRRDRDGRPSAPLGHARRIPDPRTPRRGPRPPRLLRTPRRVMTDTATANADRATREGAAEQHHHVPADLPTRIQHYIDGEFVDSVDGDTFDVLDPVTNETYLRAAAGKKADIDLAVAAARRAFTEGPWPRMLPRDRSRVLHRIADIVESRDARLAELESFDSGLPITQALGQARRAAENFRFFADLIVAQADDAYKVPGRQLNYVNRKPIGVAGLITPWNTPFMLESWKLGPALATGNTVVLKPAEFTPLSASLWAGIFEEAGLPKGVFNLVNGLGEDAGDALVKHPDVPLISFTGESSTGQLIFGNAAPFLKGLSMELGGKSPAIVFADADLEAAIDATIFGVFSLNGERCTAGSRILVQRDVYDEFVERYAAQASRVVVGYPHDPKTEVGALVHPEHYEKVMSYVELGKTEGRLVAGGGRPEGFENGNFVAPTVFADVAPDARIFQEEIFGPVVAITPFDTDDEALALANNTKYGLAAYVWTSDLKRAHNFAQAVEAGMVWLNSNNVRDLRTPFGGVKASGLGHEGGYRSIDFYTDQQAVHITLGEAHNPTFGKA